MNSGEDKMEFNKGSLTGYPPSPLDIPLHTLNQEQGINMNVFLI